MRILVAVAVVIALSVARIMGGDAVWLISTFGMACMVAGMAWQEWVYGRRIRRLLRERP